MLHYNIYNIYTEKICIYKCPVGSLLLEESSVGNPSWQKNTKRFISSRVKELRGFFQESFVSRWFSSREDFDCVTE